MVENGDATGCADDGIEAPTGDDIVFDCEHCGKSLVIDIRGAGLKVQCPDCIQDIYVPVPDDFHLADIDSRMGLTPHRLEEIESEKEGAEYQYYRDVDGRAGEPPAGLEELRLRADCLEKKLERCEDAMRNLSAQVDAMRTALRKIDDILDDLSDKTSDDTQEL